MLVLTRREDEEILISLDPEARKFYADSKIFLGPLIFFLNFSIPQCQPRRRLAEFL